MAHLGAKVLLVSLLFLASTDVGYAEDVRRLDTVALLPLTGGIADQGLWCKEGLELATEDFKAEGLNVTLKIEETQADPAKAVAAFQSLNISGLPPVIFSFGSGVGLTLSPLTNKAKIIQMGVATGTDKYTSPDDYTFRVYNRASDDANFAANVIANEFAGKSLAFLWLENENGVSTADTLRKAASERKIKEVFADSFLPGTVDFRAQLAKIKVAKPDLIVLLSYPAEGTVALKQIKELGITQPILTLGAIISGEAFTESAKSMGRQLTVLFPTPIASSASNVEFEKFEKAYSRKFGRSPSILNFYAPRSYAAFKIITEAFKSCPVSNDNVIIADCIKDKLLGAGPFPSAFGDIAFDRNGDVAAIFKLLSWENGSFKLRERFLDK